MPKPKLEIELTPLDKALELATLLAIVAIFIQIILHYGELPDRIPHHFNAAGEPDAWGSKLLILAIPVIAVGLYYLLRLLYRHRHWSNYPVKITEENAEQQYTLAIRLMRAVNLIVQLLLLFVLIWIIRVGLGKSAAPANYLVLVLTISLVVLPGLYYYAALRKR